MRSEKPGLGKRVRVTFAPVAALLMLLFWGAVFPEPAYAAACPAPANGSVVGVPGRPFGIAFSKDACWMFVSMMTGRHRGGLAVLHDDAGTYAITRVVALQGWGTDDTLTRDGRLLIVAEWSMLAAFNVDKLEQPSGDALAGRLDVGRDAGAIYVITSHADELLFASEERARRIGVFDLAKWRADAFRGDPLVGHVPTGANPVGLALSPGGHWLYATSEGTGPASGQADSCRPELASGRWHPQGLLLRIDVAKAAVDPRASLAGGIEAGCSPVRVAVAPDGSQLWVTARGGNAVLRIAAASLALAANRKVDVTSFDVGGSPVGIAIRPDGKQVWIALSNRFRNTRYNPKGREVVGLLGIDRPGTASVATASEPASAFPRELRFLPDGHTFAVGLFAAKRIEFFATPH